MPQPESSRARFRLWAGMSGVGLVAAVLCVAYATQRDRTPTVLCSERDLALGARMQGWHDVEKFRLHLKSMQSGSTASLCGPGSTLHGTTTQLEAVAQASKASVATGGVGGGILSFLESAVFGGAASVPPRTASLPSSSVLAGGEKQGKQQDKQLPVDDSTIIMAQPLKMSKPAVPRAAAPRTASPPRVQSQGVKVKGAQLESRLAKQHPKEAEQAVDTMEAEAKALGYQVVPTRLFKEASRLGYTLAPETQQASEEEGVVKAQMQARGDKRRRELRIVGDDGEALAQAKAKVTDAKAHSVGAARNNKKRPVAAAGHKEPAQQGRTAPAAAARAGAVAARSGAPASTRQGSRYAHHPVISASYQSKAASQGGLSSSDAKRLAEEHVDEVANKRHLEEVHRSASDRYKAQIQVSSREASDDASKAMNRYGSIFSFKGHEGAKEAVSNSRGRVVHQQLTDGAVARAEGQKKLDEYARLLSFSGHEGREGAHVSPGVVEQLEEGKADEFKGAEQRSEGKAAQQLKKYDVFSFHDERVARRELAHERIQDKARGGDKQGRGRLGGLARARLDRGQAKLVADASKAGFAVMQTKPGGAGGGAGLEEWNGRGVPKFS